MSESHDHKDSFEQVYPKHAFSELVRLGITFAKWVAHLEETRVRDQRRAHPSVGSASRSQAPQC